MDFFFRAAVNLSRTTYVYERKKGQDTNLELTPAKLEEGAKQIVEALWGSYSTPSGKQKVNGDLTKVRWVEGLSVAAHRLLQNIEHACRTLPGTQEVRRLMRFDTQALRILFGVPVFVTFSPDESHNLLMIRLARIRENDSFFANDKFAKLKKLYGADSPKLTETEDDTTIAVSVDKIRNNLPSYDVRRKNLAGDALASVDGFRIMIHLTFEHLFGIRFCPNCPDCNVTGNPCQDIFGSVATAQGGIFGRVDAVFTSIEAQKSTGSLHAHSQTTTQQLQRQISILERRHRTTQHQQHQKSSLWNVHKL